MSRSVHAVVAEMEELAVQARDFAELLATLRLPRNRENLEAGRGHAELWAIVDEYHAKHFAAPPSHPNGSDER